MITFSDGPADGISLTLTRAPLYLRVVQSDKEVFDALDQLDDKPALDERVYAYKRTSEVTSVHTLSQDARGRRVGRWHVRAQYQFIPIQPTQEVLRDGTLWVGWTAMKHHEDTQEKAA